MTTGNDSYYLKGRGLVSLLSAAEKFGILRLISKLRLHCIEQISCSGDLTFLYFSKRNIKAKCMNFKEMFASFLNYTM